jgi:hypothetical protein
VGSVDVGEGVEEKEGALVLGCHLQECHRLGRQLGGQLFKNHWLLHHLQTFSSLNNIADHVSRSEVSIFRSNKDVSWYILRTLSQLYLRSFRRLFRPVDMDLKKSKCLPPPPKKRKIIVCCQEQDVLPSLWRAEASAGARKSLNRHKKCKIISHKKLFTLLSENLIHLLIINRPLDQDSEKNRVRIRNTAF